MEATQTIYKSVTMNSVTKIQMCKQNVVPAVSFYSLFYTFLFVALLCMAREAFTKYVHIEL